MIRLTGCPKCDSEEAPTDVPGGERIGVCPHKWARFKAAQAQRKEERAILRAYTVGGASMGNWRAGKR